MELLIWMGKVSLYWIFFYGCFYFILRKLTYFRWNRGYLLASLVLSLILPFVRMPQGTSESLATYGVQLEGLTILPRPETTAVFSGMDLFWVAYFSVAVFFLFRLIKRLWSLRMVWEQGTLIEAEDGKTKIFLLPDDRISSFSFFNKIGISQADYITHFDEILTHEMVHVNQRHSVDIILVEILGAVFWFHPVLPFYKKSLQEVHEYLADEQTGNPDSYVAFLVAYTLGVPKFTFVNNFYSSSLLKQRIKMLYKNKSSKWEFSLYGFSTIIALVFISMIVACSERQKADDLGAVRRFDPPVVVPDSTSERIFTAVEENPQFPGGTEGLFGFLQSNIRYPDKAVRSGAQGRVFVQFVVRTDGTVSDIMVIKGVGEGLDEEAVRVVKAMPKWQPGKQSGKPVNVRYTLPINFQMDDESAEGARKTTTSVVSTNPNGQPLYVLDGEAMPDVKDIKSLEEKKGKDLEISSVSVLKDQSAVDKYGDKGKNGVVEITTRK